MNHTSRRIFRWVLMIILCATGSCILFQGCSKQTPTEAPSTTVITGVGSMGVNAVLGARDTYTFASAGHNYGKVQFVTYDGTTTFLEANGILAGSGTTAPDSGYVTGSVCSAQSLGQSFFIKTDAVPHFGKMTVTSYTVNGKAQTITVQFNWVVQTTAGDHSLQ